MVDKKWETVFDFLEKEFDGIRFVPTTDRPYPAGAEEYTNVDFSADGG